MNTMVEHISVAKIFINEYLEYSIVYSSQDNIYITSKGVEFTNRYVRDTIARLVSCNFSLQSQCNVCNVCNVCNLCNVHNEVTWDDLLKKGKEIELYVTAHPSIKLFEFFIDGEDDITYEVMTDNTKIFIKHYGTVFDIGTDIYDIISYYAGENIYYLPKDSKIKVCRKALYDGQEVKRLKYS